jgi:NAD(P)-dependent dehydrogenase (short-subunit alcohol dehydrogenase family)
VPRLPTCSSIAATTWCGSSRNISQKNELRRSDNLVLVDGDIALASTAEKIVATAAKRFGSVVALVNNAGIFRTLSPLGQIADPKDIAEAIFYLTEASQVTGEVLHVDGGSHLGRW